MKLLITPVLLFFLPGMALAQNIHFESEHVRLIINHDDGGKTSQRHVVNLLASLNEKGCNVIISDTATVNSAQLVFDSRPTSIIKKQMSDYRFIAQAKTLTGALNVKGAILVHAARGITDLASLKGEWIGFVSKKSWSGYHLPVQLLRQAGVNEATNSFYFVGNHVGAVSGLLHRDVTIAAIAEPLAQRWAKQNALSIVAISDAVETGGWWIANNVSEKLMIDCAQALTQLESSDLKALPAWIGGFVIAE